MKNEKLLSKNAGVNLLNSISILFFLSLFSAPDLLGTETLPGCYLYKNAKNIQYFKAQNQKSFFTCLGYLHGSQHPYSLDLMRRKAYGRQSVLKGQATYDSDFMMRTLNLEKLSKRLWEDLSPKVQTYLKFYSLGINTGLQEALKRRPSNYNEKTAPTEWHPRHSLALLLLYHFEVTKNQLPSLLADIPGGTKRSIRNFFPPSPSIEGHFATPHWIGLNSPLSFQFPLFKDLLGAQLKESPLFGVSIPGIPIFFQGLTQKYSWSLLPKSSPNLQSIMFVPEEDLIIHLIYPLIKIKKGPILNQTQNRKYEVTKDGHPILPLKGEKGQKALLDWRGLKLKAHHIEKLLSFQWSLSGVLSENSFHHNGPSELNEKVIKKDLDHNFFDFIVSKMDPNNDFVPTISNHFKNGSKEDFLISSSTHLKGLLSPLKKSLGKWNLKNLKAFQCSTFPFPFPKSELLKKKESFLRKVQVSRVNFPHKKALSLLKTWNGYWNKDCKACTFFYVWFYKTNEGSHNTIQIGFEETVLKFKERFKLKVPTWGTFSKANSFFPKERSFQSLLLLRDGNHKKVFFTKRSLGSSSCSLKEVPLLIDWDKEDLRYRRFKEL